MSAAIPLTRKHAHNNANAPKETCPGIRLTASVDRDMVAECTYRGVFMAAFRANGIITLTTDFGAREPFVGIMKGVMLGHAPHLRFIDMAHEVSAFQPVEAGFWL